MLDNKKTKLDNKKTKLDKYQRGSDLMSELYRNMDKCPSCKNRLNYKNLGRGYFDGVMLFQVTCKYKYCKYKITLELFFGNSSDSNSSFDFFPSKDGGGKIECYPNIIELSDGSICSSPVNKQIF